MNNKVIIGGAAALIIVVLIAFFCVWVGKKIYNSTTETTQNTETTVPNGQKTDTPVTNPQDAQKVYLALGNPSNATTDTANADNYLIVKTAYVLSYNNSRGTPNWVAWRITESDLGAADRQNDFRPDPTLPPSFKHVTPTDYAGSGFDRGHLCPSADRSSSEQANSETFLMTNMVPQTPDLNRNVWERFESYSRELVKRDKIDLYVIAGIYGEKGKLKRKVTVPSNCWKVIIPVPRGTDINSAINEKTRVIAVDMPNSPGIAGEDWRKFRTTVRSIEQRANVNLLSNLPQNLQDALETRVDNK